MGVMCYASDPVSLKDLLKNQIDFYEDIAV